MFALPRPLAGAVVCLAVILIISAPAAHSDNLTIPIENKTKKTISDITIKVLNQGTITGISDLDSFNDPPAKDLGKSTLTLSGGSIPPTGKTSVVLGTDKVAPKYDVIGLSFTDSTKRGTSTGDDIFSLAVQGGPTGKTFAGVAIPPNQFGYFYEFDRTASFPSSPSRFEVMTGSAPTSAGVLNNTWAVADLLNDLPSNQVSGGAAPLDDHMLPENLTGNLGISPATWTFSGDRMTAAYSTAFNVNDASSVLWFTNGLPPEVGGPLGVTGQNALIFGGEALLFTNGVVSPTVPEPSSVLLVGSGLAALAASYWWRRRPEVEQRGQHFKNAELA